MILNTRGMNGRSMSDSLETYQIRNSHFHELAENIESERVHFVQKLSAEQAEKVRSKDQALSVLKLIDFLRFRFDKLIEEKPHFKRLVETEFCEMSFLIMDKKYSRSVFLTKICSIKMIILYSRLRGNSTKT